MLINRDIAPRLLEAARQLPAITLTGPRQSGKTTLCARCFRSTRYVSLEDPDERAFANEDPRGFLGTPIRRAPSSTKFNACPNCRPICKASSTTIPRRVGGFSPVRRTSPCWQRSASRWPAGPQCMPCCRLLAARLRALTAALTAARLRALIARRSRRYTLLQAAIPAFSIGGSTRRNGCDPMWPPIWSGTSGPLPI